ncbi:hypothetical protein [Achromobacter pulmonis]|uniref:hypothetical protein n=1 Tax=Achromobacter pulmonis TaxID=1389932 RepID=UPI0011B1E791|nr:hypothetical protein [Achromobacter pulmonis]
MQADGWVPYEWSDEEVAEAIAYLKAKYPEAWKESEELEIATGDLREAPSANIEMGALSLAYKKSFDHRDIIFLYREIRNARRANLGLE